MPRTKLNIKLKKKKKQEIYKKIKRTITLVKLLIVNMTEKNLFSMKNLKKKMLHKVIHCQCY